MAADRLKREESFADVQKPRLVEYPVLEAQGSYEARADECPVMTTAAIRA